MQNANFNLKSGLEHKRLAIAAKSPVPGQVYKSLEDAEMYDEADEEIEAGADRVVQHRDHGRRRPDALGHADQDDA